MSSAWLLLGLFFYCGNERYRAVKEKKRSFLTKAAREDEKKAILSSIDELPSWVFFPDVERCEWLNKIIKQMWPYIGDYFKDLLQTTVLTSVEDSLPGVMKPFRFGKIQLGDIPPRIGGVKVYIDNVKRNEIYMDIEINYASDCVIEMTVKGMNLGIKDLMLHGTMRVILKPLVNKIPIIGGYTFFFLNQPTIDFDLTGVTNFLDLPVISNALRSMILEQICNYMVPPNKLSFPMVDGLTANELSHPLPEGVMRLNVVAGKNLKSADVKLIGKGKSDPYCRILVGAEKFKTKVIQNTCNPHWDDVFDIIIDQKLGQYAEVMVYDEDPGEDDELGTMSLDIQDIETNGYVDSWFPLENVKTGVIHLKATFLYLSKDKKDLETSNRISTIGSDKSSVLVMVTIDSATSLKRIKKMMEPSPYVKLTIGQKEFETRPCITTTNPRFEQTFQFLLSNVNANDIDIEVLDKYKDRPLGSTSIALKEALSSPNMTCTRPYRLVGGDTNSQIIVQVTIRILTEDKPQGWSRDTLYQAVVKEDSPDSVDNNNVKEKTPDTIESGDAIKNEKPEVAPIVNSEPIKEAHNHNQVIVTRDSLTPDHQMERVNSSPASDTLSYDKHTDDAEYEVRRRAAVNSDYDSRSESMQSTGEYLGRIQLTIRYSQQRSRLIVAVHKCVDLLACDSDGVSDPYVRLYLLPDRSSSSKRKTHTIKDELNPVFDEKVEWNISPEELFDKTLEVGVKNAVSMFSKSRTHIGKVYINLQTLDLNQASTLWYDLLNGETRKDE